MLSVIVLVLFLVTVTVSEEDEEQFEKHIQRVSSDVYLCKQPSPRVIYLPEIFGDKWETYKQHQASIRPLATVLHRCQATGCCEKYNEICRAKYEKTVPLMFLIASTSEYVLLTAVNDTECICELDNSIT
ncbi:uncharacterized protein LOC130441084 isoform X1 [Diorhabda sublineata]|uniref:uncharacterized protein LOC130441084 isoform X1 n=1 Tax=Diorhabda sublineata TaxID=1163346 RepID=UPI0024E0ABE7|nr:uncharacterized protein LOC130441084 isoform X1 [Diorhabda sublineata]